MTDTYEYFCDIAIRINCFYMQLQSTFFACLVLVPVRVLGTQYILCEYLLNTVY